MLVNGIVQTAPPLDRRSAGPAGVRVYRKGRTSGYTLFCPSMGNVVCLVDEAGVLVHFWPVEPRVDLCELLPNGNLLTDRYGEYGGLRELDPDGRSVWEWAGPYHHDFHLLADGRVVLLTRRQAAPMPDFFAPTETPQTISDDVVVEIDRSGRTIWEFSLATHARELVELGGLPRPVRYGLRRHDGTTSILRQGDWAHTNTIEVLPETPLGRTDSRFRAGNLLFSCRALDLIGVIDRDKDAVVWAWGPGELDGQHQPTMLANGHILVFDNGTHRGYSVVREIEPPEGRTVWEYRDPSGFFSPYRSGVQRLADGHTLICESDAGRIFEVTRDGAVVWDYYSPFWGGNPQNEGRHIYRATRYSDNEVSGLLARKPACSGVVGLGSRQRGAPSFSAVQDYYRNGFVCHSWSVDVANSGDPVQGGIY